MQSGKKTTSHIGKRNKLFKVSTELDPDIVKNITYAFSGIIRTLWSIIHQRGDGISSQRVLNQK
ncbi:hypothetical protein OfM2_17690 [Lactovum odontotermitis]